MLGCCAAHIPLHQLDMSKLSKENRRHNFELAFAVAEEKGQDPLLEVDDCVEMPYPDSLSVMTYIFELYRKFGHGGSLGKKHGVTRW